MEELSQERRLFREAADLAIRLQNDPANPVSLEIVRGFAARSPAHAAAWARVAEIHGLTGKVFSDQRKSVSTAPLSRRTLVIGGVLGLGAAGTASLVVPDALMRMRAGHVTQKAEIRRIDLPDGSVMTLGPDSAANLAFTPSQRVVDLIAGMAFFEVAADATRPFAAVSGKVSAIAIGTAFDLSSDAGLVTVSVGHGMVEARAPQISRGSEARLAAGDWLTLNPASGEIACGHRETSEIAAWRAGMIVADEESVAAMVAKIARWLPGRVIVADPRLGARRVSGVFDLSDPRRALAAVARPFGAQVRSLGPLLTVISPV